MENLINKMATDNYSELEDVLRKILDDEGYPKLEAAKPMDSVEANNLFMRGYMTGFNEHYSLVKELRMALADAIETIQARGCANPCIMCAKDCRTPQGRSKCDGLFEYVYLRRAERLLKCGE